jgi:hypothetical protein
MRNGLLCLLLAALLSPVGAAHAQSAPPAGSFQQAVERTTALRSFRVALQVRARGTAADPLVSPPPADERVLTDFNAVYSNGDVGLTYRAADAGARGYDPQLGLQLIVARGVTYAAGPIAVSGATEARWYNFGRRPPAAVLPPVDPAVQLTALTAPVDPAALSRTRVEQLDGRSCVVYRGGRAEVVAALARFGRPIASDPGVPLQQQLDAARLERSEYLAWVCNDGYIRQVRVSAAGTVEGRRQQPFALDVQLRFSEVGSRLLRVPVPRDAVALRPFPVITHAAVADSPLRVSPSADAPEVGRVLAREVVQLLDRASDGRWYRVRGAV